MATQAPARQPIVSGKYVLEDCAWCAGTGNSAGGGCPACEGNGKVIVAFPSINCPRCGGNGRATERAAYSYPLCTVCCGTGWALLVRN